MYLPFVLLCYVLKEFRPKKNLDINDCCLIICLSIPSEIEQYFNVVINKRENIKFEAKTSVYSKHKTLGIQSIMKVKMHRVFSSKQR